MDDLLNNAHNFGNAAGEVARLDQTTAAYKDFAEVLAKYRFALEDKGFSREEAFELVRDYQNNLMFVEITIDGSDL